MKTIVFAGGSSLLAQTWIRGENNEYKYILGIHKQKPEQQNGETYEFNYADISVLKSQLRKVGADIVINCIGLTNIEKCEKQLSVANKLNVDIPKNIALACKKEKIKLVHISTDHLFDGTVSYFSELNKKNPLNNYGISKSEGEDIVIKSNPDALVIRTNFFGWGPSYKPSFSDKIINDLENNRKLKLFDDVYYTPISVDILKKKIKLLIKRDLNGIFNICSNDRITKFEFGLMLAKTFGYNKNLIEPVSIDGFSNLTKRPKDMSLSNHKVSTTLAITIPSIMEQIEILKKQRNKHKERLVIPYGRQDISEKDIISVVNVLKSDFVTQGPTIQKFESKVADYCGAKYAYACNSATSALHIACLSLGVGEGDMVWTSPISFVASSNCALYCNADVDFVDINPITYNLSVSALEKKLKVAKRNGRLPKVVIPVHLSGQSCEMEKINSLGKKYGFKIIEDASHAIGSTYKGNPVGNCQYSDITVFSFHPVKIITTCEGGMCLTNDLEISNLIGRYRSHGITRQPSEMNKAPDGPWYYEQLNLGLNYRMNDVQAALGLSQMDRLDEFIEKRRIIAERYNEMLSESVVDIPRQHKDANSSWHLYIIRLKNNYNITHKQLFEHFRAAGVLVNIHYIPIYRQPYYESLGFDKKDFLESENYYAEAISIPIFPSLTTQEQNKVVRLIEQPFGFQNLF